MTPYWGKSNHSGTYSKYRHSLFPLIPWDFIQQKSTEVQDFEVAQQLLKIFAFLQKSSHEERWTCGTKWVGAMEIKFFLIEALPGEHGHSMI